MLTNTNYIWSIYFRVVESYSLVLMKFQGENKTEKENE